MDEPLPVPAGKSYLLSLAEIFTVISIIVASAVLIFGWLLGIEPVVRIQSGYAAMVPSTAICFVLVGAAYISWLQYPSNRRWPPLLIGAVIVAAIAATDIAILFGTSLNGIDNLLFPGRMGADGMALATATCFALATLCLIALPHDSRQADWTIEVSATTGLIAALVAILGYVYDSTALYKVFVFTAMALHTAVCFVLLFCALLIGRSETNWTGTLFGAGSGSTGARRLFPLVFIGPFLLCLIALRLTDRGYFEPNFRLSVLAISMMTIFAIGILRNANMENRTEKLLLATMDDLSRANRDKETLLREVYHRVKNNLQQVNAILGIESRQHKDPVIIASYKAMADRIRALGLVHQLLISSSSPSDVRSRQFLTELVDNIALGHDLKNRDIELTLEVDDHLLHLDVAISIGLLVNELITNAVEHAFAGRKGGSIDIRYAVNADAIELTVSDDGVGDANGSPAVATGGTGTMIVRSTVMQLDGDLSVSCLNGTKVSVTIPADINERGRYE